MANTTGKKFGGRKKGTPNKTTEEIRSAIQKVVENNIDTVEADLLKLKPQDRIKAIVELAKFVLPTLKGITLETDEGTIKPVIINLGRGIKPEEDEN